MSGSIPTSDCRTWKEYHERMVYCDKLRATVNPHAKKLTWADVLAIRRMYSAWGSSVRELMGKFNVNATTIRNIVTGKTWREE